MKASNYFPEVNSERWLCINDFKGEIWIDVPDYNGLYMVSNYGRIKSVDRVLHNIRKRFFPGIILKQYLVQHYYSVILKKDGKTKNMRVHRIVCSAFHQNNENLPYVNHKNENKLDNRADNLEWCTASYNATYNDAARKNGLKRRNNSRNSYPVLQYDKNGKFIQEYPSLGEAYRQTGVHYQNIKACFKNGKGRQLTAGSFVWVLKNGKVTVDDILSEMSDRKTMLDKQITPIYNYVNVIQYTLEGDYVMTYQTISAAAKSINVCASSIRNCLNGVTKTCGGYIWKVKNDKL